tara:strand:+ start:28 stop:594 length:567 start_codon:yes stop_codon:yes gene_type:complete
MEVQGYDIEQGVDLQCADLSGANLRGANLRGAIGTGANFEGADLYRAQARGVIFIGANFEGADLSEANLRGANLRGANFEGADLSETNFRGADLVGSSIEKAKNLGDAHYLNTMVTLDQKRIIETALSAAEINPKSCFMSNNFYTGRRPLESAAIYQKSRGILTEEVFHLITGEKKDLFHIILTNEEE